MRDKTRRPIRAGLFLLAAIVLPIVPIAQSQAPTSQTPTPSASPTATPEPSPSKVFAFDQMPARKSSNGTESRGITPFTLTTGESVGMHESTQPPGAAPVALHPVQHSELIMIQQGDMLFEHDGKQEKAGPGDVVYVAPGTFHRLTNVGTTPAKYFVLQIGGDTKR